MEFFMEFVLKKNVFLHPQKEERWPSGRRRTPGERVTAKSGSWVRIPVSPQNFDLLAQLV